MPPAAYKADQYVDSRGCVFMRAGFGGRVTWVPRVGADRRPMCGFPPTFAPVTIEMADESAPVVPEVPVKPAAPAADSTLLASVQPAKPAKVAAQPAPAQPVVTVPRIAVVQPTPPAPQPGTLPAAKPAGPGYETVAAGPGPGKIGCFTSAPVPMVVRLTNGGTAVVCTRGDGTMIGWRSPLYPAGTAPGASLSSGDGVAARGATTMAGVAAPAANAVPTPPAGYKLAWQDDRLNPLRGQGTASGQAAQDQVWTQTTPATLVADEPQSGKQGSRASVAAMNQPAAAVSQPAAKSASQAASGGAYVQVGSFGVPANARGAEARLAALGLPVARGSLTHKGKALTVVYAGPFASASAAAQALQAARSAGFSDAFIR